MKFGHKLRRREGACDVVRDDTYEGIEYDSGLFTEGEPAEFLEMAMRSREDPDPWARAERLMRAAEMVRSAETWPVFQRIGQMLSNRQLDRAFDLLRSIGLGPGDPDWEDVQQRADELEELRRDADERRDALQLEKERLKMRAEAAREQRYQALAKRLMAKRKAILSKVAGDVDDDLVRFDESSNRWVPASEPMGVQFVTRNHALVWARHIEGTDHADRDRQLLARLLSADRRMAVREGHHAFETSRSAQRRERGLGG